MSHERYYSKNKSRRQRLLTNYTYKTKEQVLRAAKKHNPKIAPATIRLDAIKVKDLMLEMRC